MPFSMPLLSARRAVSIAVSTACCAIVGGSHLLFELARDARGFLAKARASWRWLVLFNVSTAVCAWAFTASLRWLEPSVAKTLAGSVGPVLTVLVGPWVVAGFSIDSRKAAAVAGTAFSAALLAWGASAYGVAAAAWAGSGSSLTLCR